jgi:hypothetical protein
MQVMQLPHATALIAVLLIIVLSAGYAVAEAEREPGPSRTLSADSRS